jgi:uncharacterized protein
MQQSLQIRIHASIGEIDATAWDNLVLDSEPDICLHAGQRINPFMRHAFLMAAERSGSANSRTGWMPQHLVLESAQGEMLGALPCYVKSHSQGEYVFDHGWADAFERAGGRYYPKLQCTVPFTPATGPRILVRAHEDAEQYRKALLGGLTALAEKHGISSAHITFMPYREWQVAGDMGFLLRTDQQFHWHNDGYADFEAFLESLSSRKRKNIRKERKTALEDNGIEIDWLTGPQLTEEVWDRFFEFYMDTGSRKWGRPYLTRRFYSMIGQTMADDILLVMARRKGKHIAGAINFMGPDCLYGRHWGCAEDHPCLHFEVCYYQAIEYAIAHGLARVEAGAQGAHKIARGYVPVTTYSAHWISHAGLRRAIDDYLEMERAQVNAEGRALMAHAPFKKS